MIGMLYYGDKQSGTVRSVATVGMVWRYVLFCGTSSIYFVRIDRNGASELEVGGGGRGCEEAGSPPVVAQKPFFSFSFFLEACWVLVCVDTAGVSGCG